MNLQQIKCEGMRLSLEAAVGEQLRQCESAYKSNKYAAAWQNADNLAILLRELTEITNEQETIAKSNPISIDDLDDKIERADPS